MNDEKNKEKSENEKYVSNYYQGIYVTETILGNPNGDFIDNSPRNFDGRVFTTDKCIKYNIRKYLYENGKEVFFFPRRQKRVSPEDAKFLTKESIYKDFFNSNFEEVLDKCPDVRMFGGTFSFKKSKDGKKENKQIYGPIQISYGVDINDAQIKRLQIGAPFSTEDGNQTTTGSEAVVDDAVIVYDITINPNNYRGLLKESDLKLFKEAIWYGTNLRKSTSKKTDSKLLLLIKFKNEGSENNGEKKTVRALNLGELKHLIKVENKDERKRNPSGSKLKIDLSGLSGLLTEYKDYIEAIEIIKANDVECTMGSVGEIHPTTADSRALLD